MRTMAAAWWTTCYERTPKSKRRLHIRVRGLDRAEMPTIREGLKQKAKLLYVIDMRENRLQIFETADG